MENPKVDLAVRLPGRRGAGSQLCLAPTGSPHKPPECGPWATGFQQDWVQHLSMAGLSCFPVLSWNISSICKERESRLSPGTHRQLWAGFLLLFSAVLCLPGQGSLSRQGLESSHDGLGGGIHPISRESMLAFLRCFWTLSHSWRNSPVVSSSPHQVHCVCSMVAGSFLVKWCEAQACCASQFSQCHVFHSPSVLPGWRGRLLCKPEVQRQ